ncbi:MAG: T9SS type A sorting domain-containing protein [Tannerella sp.]|nr:T9SS type A sorting domain-containing protein [Tannerella sp.]
MKTMKWTALTAMMCGCMSAGFAENGIDGLTHPASLDLIDLSGRRVLARQVSNGDYVRVGALPTGICVAVLATEQGRIQRKIVKR